MLLYAYQHLRELKDHCSNWRKEIGGKIDFVDRGKNAPEVSPEEGIPVT